MALSAAAVALSLAVGPEKAIVFSLTEGGASGSTDGIVDHRVSTDGTVDLDVPEIPRDLKYYGAGEPYVWILLHRSLPQSGVPHWRVKPRTLAQ